MSDDADEQVVGDFMNPDGAQSLVPNELLSFSSACQALVPDYTDPSHRDSVVHVRHWSWMTLFLHTGIQ